MESYTVKLKTLNQPDEVNIIIDRYLLSLEKIEYNNNCNKETELLRR